MDDRAKKTVSDGMYIREYGEQSEEDFFEQLKNQCHNPPPNIYAWLRGFEDFFQGTLDSCSNEPLQIERAKDGLSAIRTLKHHVDEEDVFVGDIHFVIQNSYKIGQLAERIQAAQFAPKIRSRKVQDDALHVINSERKRPKLKREAEEMLAVVQQEKPHLGLTSQKAEAAKRLDIKLRQFQIRLAYEV